MSLEAVEREIAQFLASPAAEALCLIGKWGVGKTYAWNRFLRIARDAHKIALHRYAYISLFGINSLDELRYSAFENSVGIESLDVKPNLDTLRANTTGVADRLGRKSLWFLQQLPIVRNYVGGLGPVWFLTVRNQIICIDDFERKGSNLQTRDVLGLITHLKEEKQCKVILILNEEALEENDKGDFAKYFDKSVESRLTFAPTPEECTRIALSRETRTTQLLSESCIRLGLANIRLIKRIERLALALEPILAKFEDPIATKVLRSLVLLGWSRYEPEVAPSIDFLKSARRMGLYGDTRSTEAAKANPAWNSLLDSYGFVMLDEFDMVLAQGVEDGFFGNSHFDIVGTSGRLPRRTRRYFREA